MSALAVHILAALSAALLLTVTLCTAGHADDVSPSSPPNAPEDDQQHHVFTDWGGLREAAKSLGVKFALVEQSEVWGNLTGGLRQGLTYNGLTTASVKINLDTLMGWKDAWFYISAFNIHGRGPSGNLAGNMQLLSNIEATRDTKLYDLWIDQHLWDGKISIRFGQEGANDEMMTTQYAGLFLNSSFGFPGLPAADLPSGGPNYPMATPFARIKVRASDALTLVGAVYNGDPAPPGMGDPQLRDAGGTAFRLNDHTLGFGELWYSVGQGKGELPGTYKLGAWYSTSPFADQRFDTQGMPLASPLSNGRPLPHSGGYAIYGIVDQMIWRPPDACDDCGLGVFAQVMVAPSRFNLSDRFVEAGFNWKGLFKGRDNDTLGLGMSYVAISSAAQAFGADVIAFTGTGTRFASNETVIEATYAYKATEWFALQPDLQYVINPNAGIPTASNPTHLKNAIVVGTRATIAF